jgi:two-component system response regulator HydG
VAEPGSPTILSPSGIDPNTQPLSSGNPGVYNYLTMTVGQRAGTNFLLDSRSENRIGRGTECAIMLTDPLCSRVHVVVALEDNEWRVRDAQSRNGTFVNGQKVDEAVLANGHYLRVGSTEFTFYQSEQPPTIGPITDLNITQTVVKDARVKDFDSSYFALSALRDAEHARDLLMLYQLSIKLLGCNDPQQLMRYALELLRSRTKASVVGFLWIDDEGRLLPKLVIPEQQAQPVVLNEALTRLVCQENKAVWIANQQTAGAKDSLEHYADALCVPLVSHSKVLGAMHVYLERGRFRQSHFDFSISVANITAVALIRSLTEERLETDFQRLKETSPGYDELVGESPAMLELKAKITRLSKASGSVLVRGESGTGKELVARALHRGSTRADRPMLAVNCAAIPAELMDSQLFGHKAGSFTGADRNHVGYFQQADLGTLFLDEIGELTLPGQSKLLRILEGHPFLPVGGNQEIRVDVRVIAATNRDLLSYVGEKKFREDLFYRLNVFELIVPPLRERGEDISVLIDYFLAHFTRQHARPGLTLSDEARQKLLSYSWPGNVRQLRNVLDSAVVLAGGKRIEARELGLRDTGQTELDTLRIEDWERKLIAEALKRTGDNIPESAKLLGIGRATLYRKIEEYHIARP